MQTITPPETREDEFQVDDVLVDESADNNILLRMSPTRAKQNRVARNARGFNYIQLIVGMIIFVALSRIVGPPAFRMITRARSTALEANIQTAAETVRNVLAIDPAKRGDPSNLSVVTHAGQPPATFLAALTDDAPFNWQGTWPLDAGDDSDTIRVQFIAKGSTGPALGPVPPASPSVGWLLNAWDAVRIQAKNQDNAWACALIVLKPNSADLDVGTGNAGDGEIDVDGNDDGTGTQISTDLANAHLRGIWYDSGPTYDTADQGLHHCSPVASSSSTTPGTCTVSGSVDPSITDSGACSGTGGVWAAGSTTVTATAPLPGSANAWPITADRVFNRNV